MRSRDKDWNVACGVYPDLRTIFNRLGAISSKLSAAYKIVMLDTKNFSDRNSIAINLDKKFLESYFGSDPRIIQFAKALIIEKKRDAAKSLNEYVRVIGVDNSQQVIAINNINEILIPMPINSSLRNFFITNTCPADSKSFFVLLIFANVTKTSPKMAAKKLFIILVLF